MFSVVASTAHDQCWCPEAWQRPLCLYNVMAAGPGKGIGRAIAVRFAEEGGRLVLAGRKADVLEEVCSHPAALYISRMHCRHPPLPSCYVPDYKSQHLMGSLIGLL